MSQALTLPPPPRGVLSLALLLWGWQSGYWPIAILLGILLELAHHSNRQVQLEQRDFNRLADITTFIFMLVVAYQFSTRSVLGIYGILTSLPLVFFPLLLAQQASIEQRVPLAAFFMSLRKLNKKTDHQRSDSIDLGYPYLILTLLAATPASNDGALFFFAAALLLGIVLWPLRPRHTRPGIWLMVYACVLVTAFALQQGLYRSQMQLERVLFGVLSDMALADRDVSRDITAIGYIGRLKLSDAIRIRAWLPEARPGQLQKPLLLREAVYDQYSYGVWRAGRLDYTVIDAEIGGRQWQLERTDKATRQVRISSRKRNELSVMPLPHGTSRIVDVSAFALETTPIGTVMLEARPGWVSYDIEFTDTPDFDGSPREQDLVIGNNYREMLASIVNELELEGLDATAAISRVEDFFARNFSYSLEQQQRFRGDSRLEDFLYHRRTGHCEYFATATALLLRMAGIPARYAVGYSIQEYSALERAHIARARHAHSWVLAHTGDQWQIVDTTPPVWEPMEAADTAWWRSLLDGLALVQYQFIRLRNYIIETEALDGWLPWTLPVLILWLSWRVLRRRARTSQPLAHNRTAEPLPAQSMVEKLLQQIAGPEHWRQNGETLQHWSQRLSPANGNQELQELINDYYRYRFDPDSDKQYLQKRLEAKIKRWRQHYQRRWFKIIPG
ncbi:MAG: transglutaminase-like domain-containing protein [Gammaproteobacteria bacterium]